MADSHSAKINHHFGLTQWAKSDMMSISRATMRCVGIHRRYLEPSSCRRNRKRQTSLDRQTSLELPPFYGSWTMQFVDLKAQNWLALSISASTSMMFHTMFSRWSYSWRSCRVSSGKGTFPKRKSGSNYGICFLGEMHIELVIIIL